MTLCWQRMDQRQVSALCLIHLTAAFDTIDYSLLLMHLQRFYGVDGCCLKWYMSQCHLQRVLGATGLGIRPSPLHPIHGVPSWRRHRTQHVIPWQQSTLHSLLSVRRLAVSSTQRTILHLSHWAVDDRQPMQTQHGQELMWMCSMGQHVRD